MYVNSLIKILAPVLTALTLASGAPAGFPIGGSMFRIGHGHQYDCDCADAALAGQTIDLGPWRSG